MIAMHTWDNRYRGLKRYKEVLAGMANKHAYRSRIRRNGQVGAGPFWVEIRRSLFADLKELEDRTGWQLISAEEERCIRADWDLDDQVHCTPCETQPMLWDLRGQMVGCGAAS